MFLENDLDKIEQLIPDANKKNTAISTVGVDWHLDHMLKVIIGVSKRLKASDPSEYRWKFNFVRAFIYLFNFIPRGKGKSPKSVLPPEEITSDDLKKQLEEAKFQLGTISQLDPKSNFAHPYFGMLNLKSTKKFLKLHTQHHLSIIYDIVKR